MGSFLPVPRIYWSIGSGADNANSWLNFRGQQFGLNPRQSAYHGYEAKIMASMAPTVNKNLDLIVAFTDRHYILTAEKPEAEGCPVSLPDLKSWYKKFGPQDSNELGHKLTKPSISQKLKRGQ